MEQAIRCTALKAIQSGTPLVDVLKSIFKGYVNTKFAFNPSHVLRDIAPLIELNQALNIAFTGEKAVSVEPLVQTTLPAFKTLPIGYYDLSIESNHILSFREFGLMWLRLSASGTSDVTGLIETNTPFSRFVKHVLISMLMHNKESLWRSNITNRLQHICGSADSGYCPEQISLLRQHASMSTDNTPDCLKRCWHLACAKVGSDEAMLKLIGDLAYWETAESPLDLIMNFENDETIGTFMAARFLVSPYDDIVRCRSTRIRGIILQAIAS